jgi:hypothetical protein
LTGQNKRKRVSLNPENFSKVNIFFQKLIFGGLYHTGLRLLYMCTQIVLFIFIFIFISGFFTVMSRFLLTYLTLGPAKLSIESFAYMQTLFWIFFILSRFCASYVALIFDGTKFYLFVLISNTFVSVLFLIPYLTVDNKMFFWFGISMLGLTSGPTIPSGLMVAKQILNFNAFLLSLFIVGIASGGILFQQLIGYLLDTFKSPQYLIGFDNKNINSSYIIPYIAFLASLLSLLFYIPVYLLNKLYSNGDIKKYSNNNNNDLKQSSL